MFFRHASHFETLVSDVASAHSSAAPLSADYSDVVLRRRVQMLSGFLQNVKVFGAGGPFRASSACVEEHGGGRQVPATCGYATVSSRRLASAPCEHPPPPRAGYYCYYKR